MSQNLQISMVSMISMLPAILTTPMISMIRGRRQERKPISINELASKKCQNINIYTCT